MEVRKAAFAGSWYPSRASSCEEEIRQFLSEENDKRLPGRKWMGGIVPHAGWYFSGSIACRVIDHLKEPDPPDLVVIFGMHLHPQSANYIMPQGAWETPFGDLPVAEKLAAALLQRFTFQVETAQRFVKDNTVELQLPFIKRLLDPAAILAIGVPPTAASLAIGRAVVDWARENQKTLKIIGSTDLTHYGPGYGFTPQGSGPEAIQWVRNQNDRRVIDAMLALNPEQVIEEGLRHENACCAGAAATAMAAAAHMGATHGASVAYGNSHDKSPGDSFVGYAGVVFGQ